MQTKKSSTPKKKTWRDRMTFESLGPKISPEYQKIIDKNKAANDRLNQRGPFLRRDNNAL